MNKQKYLLVLVIFVLACSSCVNVLNHNEDVAASKAIEFAKAAFIERNYEKAAQLIPKEQQNPDSAKQIEALTAKMHPDSYPTKVTATEYEPVPGQKAIKIFLIGENNQNEKFYYLFVLHGTIDEGYTVAEGYRNADPFPSSQLRKPLPVKRSTGG